MKCRARAYPLIAAVLLAAAGLGPITAARAETEADRVAFEAGFDMATHYTFRGFSQESRGFIGQPWAEVGFNLFAGDGTIASMDLVVGTWNSVHGARTFATHSPGTWYESDLYVELSASMTAGLFAGVGYTLYMSPSGAFDAVGEIGVSLGYVLPEALLGRLTLELGAGLFTELGDLEARMIELSVGPEMPLFESGAWSVDLSLPVVVGLDLGTYYGDDTFGFLDAGARVISTLPFVPAGFGAWEAFAGVHYVRLGGEAAEASLPFIGASDRGLVYATTGIALAR